MKITNSNNSRSLVDQQDLNYLSLKLHAQERRINIVFVGTKACVARWLSVNSHLHSSPSTENDKKHFIPHTCSHSHTNPFQHICSPASPAVTLLSHQYHITMHRHTDSQRERLISRYTECQTHRYREREREKVSRADTSTDRQAEQNRVKDK